MMVNKENNNKQQQQQQQQQQEDKKKPCSRFLTFEHGGFKPWFRFDKSWELEP